MKSKTAAFTLVELMVTLVILGIVGSATAPTFRSTFQAYVLNEDFTLLYDTVLEARDLSLSKKVCPSGNPSGFWGLQFNDDNTYSLICDDVNNNRDTLRTESPRSTNTLAWYDPVNEQDDAELHFLPQQLTTEIFFEGALDIAPELRVVLSSPSLNESKTLCLHRIQGFPRINDEGDTCP